MINLLHFHWQRPGDTCHFPNNVTNSVKKLRFHLIGHGICSSCFNITAHMAFGGESCLFIEVKEHVKNYTSN